MTDHDPGTLVGLHADRIQVAVPAEQVEGTHTYRTVTSDPDEPETVTATIEAGKTFFECRGETFVFDGVMFFPENEYRDDDDIHHGNVRLKTPYGDYPDEGHALNPRSGKFKIEDFARMLVRGDLSPAEEP